MESIDSLDVWYVSDLALCNFDCRYCASGDPDAGGLRSRERMWLTDASEARFETVVGFIERIPARSIGLRFQTIGEPFVSETFLRAAARLTRSPRMRFVELVTNGSLLRKRLPAMIEEQNADPEKLSLWITFHHTEIAVDRLVDHASFAADLGAHIVVNALLFADNAEAVRTLAAECQKRGLRTNIDLGLNFNNAYQGEPFVPLMDDQGEGHWPLLLPNRRMAATSLVAVVNPQGLRCSAGHDYVFISHTGDVFPCHAYSKQLPKSRLGSALDPEFRLELRSRRHMGCALVAGCTCKEDYLHLEVAEPGPQRERSLGYWPAGDAEAHVPDVLTERLEQVGRYPILRVLR
jgi:MoaA/NifB/PqqE/SkfB family radical SAM enzyme